MTSNPGQGGGGPVPSGTPTSPPASSSSPQPGSTWTAPSWGNPSAGANSSASPAPGSTQTSPAADPSPVSYPDDLGSSLSVGDSLSVGQRLVNGDYTLAFQNGNLVLTGADGRHVWESNTSNANGQILRLTLDPDGSLDEKASAGYQAMTEWSTLAGLYGAHVDKLVLGNDGSITIVDASDPPRVLATIIGPETTKHAYLVQLQPPMGSPPAVQSGLAAIQQNLQDAVDLMGAGKPSDIPDMERLSSIPGLSYSEDTGETIDQYAAKLGDFTDVMAALRKADVDVNAATSSLAPKIEHGRNQMIQQIESLKDVLRAPRNASGAPAAVKSSPSGLQYDIHGDIVSATMDSDTARYVLGAAYDCLHSVEQIKQSISDDAGRTGNDIGGKTPGGGGGGGGGGGKADRPTGTGGAPGGAAIPGVPGQAAAGTAGNAGNPNNLPGGPAPVVAPIVGASTGATNDDVVAAIDAATNKIQNSGARSTPVTGGTGATGSGATNAGRGSVSASGSGSSGGPSAGSGDGGLPNLLGSLAPEVMMAVVSAIGPLTSLASEWIKDNSPNREPAPAGSRNPGAPAQAPVAASGASPSATPMVGDPPPVTATSTTNPPSVEPADQKTVPITLDGQTQQVSVPVRDALVQACNNPNGSDAVAAYSGAAGPESSWSQVDASDLHTGDVVKWAAHTGLVVRQPDRTLHLIFGGTLVPLNEQDLDEHGFYPVFQGYVRPGGVGIAAAAAQAISPAVPAAPAQLV
ncbi:hypothetical protein [Nocardia tengchongensis]|uniref:hypothetical protein n=2 Tax=Nocardia tengchongensis TaxID=2055889 RepID=UPI0036C4D6EE